MAEKSLFHQPRCLELQRIKLVNITVSFWNVVIPKKYLLEQHGIFLHCENSRSYKDFDYLKKKSVIKDDLVPDVFFYYSKQKI